VDLQRTGTYQNSVNNARVVLYSGVKSTSLPMVETLIRESGITILDGMTCEVLYANSYNH